jgi:hypothetical protein
MKDSKRYVVGNPFYTRRILGEGKILYDREASEDRDGKTAD